METEPSQPLLDIARGLLTDPEGELWHYDCWWCALCHGGRADRESYETYEGTGPEPGFAHETYCPIGKALAFFAAHPELQLPASTKES